MDFRTLLGEEYREDMTVEELQELITGREDVSIVTEPFVKKNVFDKTASELASLKKELRALKESNMTESELLQAELDKAQETQSAYMKELAKLRATEVFVTAGLTEDDFGSILETIVVDDAEISKVRAEQMVSLIQSQRDAVDRAVREELLNTTPKPKGGGKGDLSATLQKEIELAQANNDQVTVAALIRQQAQENAI